MKTHEERVMHCEVRATGTGSVPTITGYASLFNTRADIGGKFDEMIAPGAFGESIAKDDVRALFNHDPSLILGRNKAGTLRMVEDAKGLAVEIDLPDTQLGRDLAVSMKRGDISQMSFGFSVPDGGQRVTHESGKILRTITRAKLFDASVVSFPAYESTSATLRGVRSAGDILQELAGMAADIDPRIDLYRRRLELASGKRHVAPGATDYKLDIYRRKLQLLSL